METITGLKAIQGSPKQTLLVRDVTHYMFLLSLTQQCDIFNYERIQCNTWAVVNAFSISASERCPEWGDGGQWECGFVSAVPGPEGCPLAPRSLPLSDAPSPGVHLQPTPQQTQHDGGVLVWE